jgi:hypothetical protein
MSTYSSNLKIELVGTGEQSGTWGVTTNNNFANVFEQAIVGRGNPDYASDANLTLTYTDSVASQTARNLYLNVTSSVGGGLTATRNLVVPTINKTYVVENNTTGGQSIIVKTSAGAGVTVPNGKTVALYVDGTDVVAAFDHISTALSLGNTLSVAGAASLTSATVSSTLGVTGNTALSTLSATGNVTFSGTGSTKLQAGTTAQRPGTPADGMIRYNSDEDSFEGYINGAWGGISGAQANGVIYENNLVISSNYTLTTGKNGMSVGPITIDSGVSVTVPSGQRWVVL